MFTRKWGGVSLALLLTLGLVACGKTESNTDTPPENDDVDDATESTGGSGGDRAGTGGTPPLGSSGGGPADQDEVFEPDEDEECTLDPRADDWVQGVIPGMYLGEEVKVGGNLLLAAGLKSEGRDLYVGHVSGDSLSFGSLLEFGPEAELEEWQVAPDGDGAMIIYGTGTARMLRMYSIDLENPGWLEPIPVPPALQEGGIGLLMLSQGRALVSSSTGTGLRIHEFDGQAFAEGGVAEFFSAPQRGANDTLVSYRSPTLTADPHKRIEYVWGEGFGAPEDLPEVIETGYSWSAWHREYPSGVGLRAVTTASDDPNIRGTYLHTRRSGVWDSGLHFSALNDAKQSAPEWWSHAGPDLLYFRDDGPALTVQSSSDSSWTDAQPLPRSRSTTYVGAAGDADGTALVVAEQVIADEGVHALKLYRRGEDGTWYCPVLVPPQLSHSVHSDEGGSYLATTGGYELPLTVWMLPRGN